MRADGKPISPSTDTREHKSATTRKPVITQEHNEWLISEIQQLQFWYKLEGSKQANRLTEMTQWINDISKLKPHFYAAASTLQHAWYKALSSPENPASAGISLKRMYENSSIYPENEQPPETLKKNNEKFITLITKELRNTHNPYSYKRYFLCGLFDILDKVGKILPVYEAKKEELHFTDFVSRETTVYNTFYERFPFPSASAERPSPFRMKNMPGLNPYRAAAEQMEQLTDYQKSGVFDLPEATLKLKDKKFIFQQDDKSATAKQAKLREIRDTFYDRAMSGVLEDITQLITYVEKSEVKKSGQEAKGKTEIPLHELLNIGTNLIKFSKSPEPVPIYERQEAFEKMLSAIDRLAHHYQNKKLLFGRTNESAQEIAHQLKNIIDNAANYKFLIHAKSQRAP